MTVQLAGNVAHEPPLAQAVARDEGRDVDLRHEGPIDEELAVVEGVERLLDPHVDAQPRRGEVVVERTVLAPKVRPAAL